MADIRKRTGKNGTTYQVRYASKGTQTGYAYETFHTLKEARDFLQSGKTLARHGQLDTSIRTVSGAVSRWLKICESEGTDGNEPVTKYTLQSYEYFAEFMNAYNWPKALQDLTAPDIVEFRSWLLNNSPSRYVARKALGYFHSVLHEMALRGHINSNIAAGVSIKSDSRYDTPIVIPTPGEIRNLLSTADQLAKSKNKQTARTWGRYRPILYLAVDSGMRPQEYLALAHSSIHGNGIKVERAIEGGSKKISVTKTRAGRRFIEISDHTLDMVRYYSEHSSAPNDYDLVFPTTTGKWQCPRNWRNRGFNEICLKAGLVEQVQIAGRIIEQPKYRPYDLRHFYASMLFAKKINLKKIQVLMGHTNITTTLNVYGHLIDGMHGGSEEAGILNQIGLNSCGKSVASTT